MFIQMFYNEILVQGTREQVPPAPRECAGSNGKFCFIHVSSEGSGESAHLSLARAFAINPKPHVLAQISFFILLYASRKGYGESTHLLGLV